MIEIGVVLVTVIGMHTIGRYVLILIIVAHSIISIGLTHLLCILSNCRIWLSLHISGTHWHWVVVRIGVVTIVLPQWGYHWVTLLLIQPYIPILSLVLLHSQLLL